MLYFTADDLGARLGVYGNRYAHTPHVDAFAKESLLFERCYCQVAICGASRISILTGIRPEKSQIFGLTEQWRQRLPSAVSLVRLYRDAGYHTYGIGKINDPRNGRLDDAWTVDETAELGVVNGKQTFDMLRRVAADPASPFFLAIGTRQPHCPWTPSAQSLASYKDEKVPVEAPGRRMDTSCGYPDKTLTEARVQYFTELHYASITDVDSTFGEVMSKAEDLGLLDNTIVIFWSGDHGYSLGENGVWGKWSDYDVVTRIPLLMKVPGMRTAGRRTPALVEAVDMYPTLVELCGLRSPPQHLDGVSFVPLFNEPQRPWKTATFNVSAPYGRTSAMKTDRYDLIVPEGSSEIELYDLTRDPMETQNLAPSSPKLLETLRRRFDAGPDAAKPPATGGRLRTKPRSAARPASSTRNYAKS